MICLVQKMLNCSLYSPVIPENTLETVTDVQLRLFKKYVIFEDYSIRAIFKRLRQLNLPEEKKRV